jgi:ATP-dependent Clp protease ATP-binding subunit ClpC
MVFRSLSKSEIKEIVRLELDKIQLQLDEHDVALRFTDKACDFMAKEGYSLEFGARQLRRVIQQHVKDPLSEGILAGEFQPETTVLVDLNEEGDGVVLRTIKDIAPSVDERVVLEAMFD